MPRAKKTSVPIAQEIEKEAGKVLSESEQFAKSLEGKTVQELRILHDQELFAESETKRLLVLLRERAANLPTLAGPEAEHEIIRVKEEITKAAERIKILERSLEGELKDLWGNTF